jgi:NADH dehydrogenase FAD-containing subunit
MSGEKKRILVAGAGYAGVACAVRLARKVRGTGASVALADPRPYFVERVRLHEDVAGDVRRRAPLRDHVGAHGVEVIDGRVEGVDLVARRARIRGRDEAFDELVVATGSSAAPPAHAFAVATEEDAFATRVRLASPDVRRVVIAGGGLTGVELAAELATRRRGLAIALVTAGEVLPDLSTRARAHARSFLVAHGVEVLEHRRVALVEPDAVVLSSGDVLPSDATIWTGGFRPSRLAADIGLRVDLDGRATVDERLRSTSHPFVHVAGDAASTGVRMACAVALPTGCFVADDLARAIHDREPRPFSFGFYVTCVSLGRRDGLFQRTDVDDRPSGWMLDGRAGAWLKELVCRYAMASTNEGWGIEYRWPNDRRHADLRERTSAPLRHRLPDAR